MFSILLVFFSVNFDKIKLFKVKRRKARKPAKKKKILKRRSLMMKRTQDSRWGHPAFYRI